MPLRIACPKCRSQYQIPETALGKTVKCKKCNSSFKAQTAPKQRATTTPSAPSQDLQRFGLEGLKRQQDIFSAPPTAPQGALGNFADDPGFADIKTVQAEIEEDKADDGLSDIVNNPFATPVNERNQKNSSKKRKAGGKKKKAKKPVQPCFLTMVIFIPWFIVAGALELFLPPYGFYMAVAGLVLLGLASIAISIWFLKSAFDHAEGAEFILVLLIPFYAFFFIYKRWAAMKNATYATIAANICFLMGFGAIVIPKLLSLGSE